MTKGPLGLRSMPAILSSTVTVQVSVAVREPDFAVTVIVAVPLLFGSTEVVALVPLTDATLGLLLFHSYVTPDVLASAGIGVTVALILWLDPTIISSVLGEIATVNPVGSPAVTVRVALPVPLTLSSVAV